MIVEIAALAGSEAAEFELRALREWLQQESPSPGRVDTVTPPREPGTMGALTDALQVALGAGGAGTILAGSLATWLTTRRGNVRLRLKRPDGVELEVDAQVNDPEAAISRFLTGVHTDRS